MASPVLSVAVANVEMGEGIEQCLTKYTNISGYGLGLLGCDPCVEGCRTTSICAEHNLQLPSPGSQLTSNDARIGPFIAGPAAFPAHGCIGRPKPTEPATVASGVAAVFDAYSGEEDFCNVDNSESVALLRLEHSLKFLCKITQHQTVEKAEERAAVRAEWEAARAERAELRTAVNEQSVILGQILAALMPSVNLAARVNEESKQSKNSSTVPQQAVGAEEAEVDQAVPWIKVFAEEIDVTSDSVVKPVENFKISDGDHSSPLYCSALRPETFQKQLLTLQQHLNQQSIQETQPQSSIQLDKSRKLKFGLNTKTSPIATNIDQDSISYETDGWPGTLAGNIGLANSGDNPVKSAKDATLILEAFPPASSAQQVIVGIELDEGTMVLSLSSNPENIFQAYKV